MNEPASALFNADERDAAERALKIYERQVNGSEGLRWLFDHGPDDFQIVLDRIPIHQRELLRFEEAVKEFGDLVDILEVLADRPAVTHGNTYVVTVEAVNGFRQIHRALVSYATALEQQGSRATAAAYAVACAVNPEVWRDAGALVPEDVDPNCRHNVSNYLRTITFA